jgi:hypothetical protein
MKHEKIILDELGKLKNVFGDFAIDYKPHIGVIQGKFWTYFHNSKYYCEFIYYELYQKLIFSDNKKYSKICDTSKDDITKFFKDILDEISRECYYE